MEETVNQSTTKFPADKLWLDDRFDWLA